MSDIINVNGVEYVKKEKVSNLVLVRTFSAGVHYGEIVKRNGKEIVLKNSRRIWRWSGAATLSQIAVAGLPNNSEQKISVSVPEIILTEAIEIISITEQGEEKLKRIPTWTV